MLLRLQLRVAQFKSGLVPHTYFFLALYTGMYPNDPNFKSHVTWITWRKSIFRWEVVADYLLVIGVCDIHQVLTYHIVLSQPDVGGDGLAGEQDGGIFVQS